MGDDPEAALDLIYTEYSARCQSGTTPAPTEFYERFPQWQRQLEHQFQLADLLTARQAGPKPLAHHPPAIAWSNC